MQVLHREINFVNPKRVSTLQKYVAKLRIFGTGNSFSPYHPDATRLVYNNRMQCNVLIRHGRINNSNWAFEFVRNLLIPDISRPISQQQRLSAPALLGVQFSYLKNRLSNVESALDQVSFGAL